LHGAQQRIDQIQIGKARGLMIVNRWGVRLLQRPDGGCRRAFLALCNDKCDPVAGVDG
jgi:hypothetical protein